MTTNTAPVSAMLAAIISKLDLDERTIVFHDLNGILSAGSVLDKDDIIDSSDAFLDLAADNDSAPAIDVSECITYTLGNGETDSATAEDIRTLEAFREADPRTFAVMLDRYADILAALDCLTIPNPYYFDD